MDKKTHPKVSLLIAMRNEATKIGGCLDSIFQQDYPPDRIEVLVMDGESTDASRQAVEGLIEGRSNCKLVSNPGIYQSHGWNIGIAHSTGDIVGIVSAHSLLDTDYVSKAVETLLASGADMVGGTMKAIGATYIAAAISLATSSPFGVGDARFHYTEREEEMDTVYMGLCWRSVYQRIGGFDQDMVRNQDDELSYRLRKAGGRIVCNPAIRSRYYNRASLPALWRQYYQYGYYKVRVLQKHPAQMRPRQFIPPLFVLSLAASVLFALTPSYWLGGFIVPLLYVLTNLLASLRVASKQGGRYLSVLPLVFFILHLGYGVGFLAGLIKFRSRWNDKVGKTPIFTREPA
ncbi:MAG: glycosyltransferase family 2 protein [Chloroflexota bacterium]